MWLPITLGESLGRGHFYLAETRTFLLCVDTNLPPEHAPSGDHEVQLLRNGAGNWPPCTIKKMILRLTWTATCSAISYLRGKVLVKISERLTFRDVTGKSIWKERLP